MEEPSEAKSPLEELPIELMHQIYGFCPLNAKICLKMCCKKLHDETTTKPLGQFDGLCLEDIYTGSNTDRHVCGVCRLVHRAGEFTEQELEKDPRKRVCKDSQRLLDLTPGISFTYQQLLHSRNVLLSLKSPYDEDFTFRLVEDKSGQWMIIMDWTFGMQYSPPAAWDGELRHLRENFPAIISYWEDDHANPAIVECYTCDTKVELTIPTRPVDNGDNWAAAPWVSFHAERRLGKLGESAVDPRWKAQSLPQI
ncbi:MAG: hypothetical protein ASARMPREDX12_002041 [Alectoria sarmentosa]|nr:MAG: hypothetical protein ASARMPREDX12_002041 [Alectoria sarmentosa]